MAKLEEITMIQNIIDRIEQQQIANDGCWPIPTRPKTKAVMSEMKVVYVHQSILGLSLFPFRTIYSVEQATNYLLSSRK